ncbi:MAG: guanylate kinase [Synergistaceae bacterium]|jgi:guanylate kinase|nr:guanylate kinase [Synergistaceae bacterium]
MKERGNLFILSGPAGAGKGTLRKKLFEEMPDLVFSVSCTTREMRPGETDGADYRFITGEEFARMAEGGEFLEWAEVHGNCYGTRRGDVDSSLGEGRDVLLEIDVQGARQVKSKVPDAILIFITAPSLDELECRLAERGTESRDQMAVRLRNAAEEMSRAHEYDHIVVNDRIDRAAYELAGIIEKYRSRRTATSSSGGAER